MEGGGNLYILDMGSPLNITDLAKQMIRFYGFEPERDIPIHYTGIRPRRKIDRNPLGPRRGAPEYRLHRHQPAQPENPVQRRDGGNIWKNYGEYVTSFPAGRGNTGTGEGSGKF